MNRNPRLPKLVLAAALVAAASLSGCCYGDRVYVQQVGPLQAFCVSVTPVDQSRGATAYSTIGDGAGKLVITRHYMGPRPPWYYPDYLPEPRVCRSCTGSLYVEQYVWGYPPQIGEVRVEEDATSTAIPRTQAIPETPLPPLTNTTPTH